ncbi:MAG: glycosyltransferase [Hallerella porci]|uniref:Glycosyltransferase involved in cell wall biosynthesis n=1 Tax=Hallerella porci TaxID=1945871 RepID=A0ABX5LLH4_9BACT|nr:MULTISPECIES: glycosyltransferase [Hallerella]MCI5601718.1 glycosyltransferase [Hallerella sp.]MDY3920584.1 glycosyltransferase [Hallerella porci]PWK93246.1 glycosyltransferase involved in cell wall biosynthesis [Hallerella porci]
MIIGLVIDTYDALNNGTTASARRFVENLRKEGHTVRVLTAGAPGKDKFILPKWNIPIVSHFADPQGITFAKIDAKVIREFLTGLDVVHFYLPFPLARAVEKMAREMQIPCLAAFHVQAENITYNIGLGKVSLAAKFFYRFLYHYFYKRFNDIHCPTEFIAGELRDNGYKANLHVISNGVDAAFTPGEMIPHENIRVLMIGRLSPEKRQDLIIAAAKKSKYADKIQLVFAGQGPLLEKYKKLSRDLPREPIFGFYSTEELLKIIRSTDIYVHASDAEIEAIACMEAFACGLVPIIANAKKSATVHFALDERSLFKPGDADDLAQKIDYWIEHPEEKALMSKRFIDQGNQYRVKESVKKIEEVYKNLKPGRPQ